MIEDSPTDSNIIEILLKREQFHFRIHVVKDGEAALAFLKHTGAYKSAPVPALVLLDLNLPKLDGTLVLREIKADPKLKAIPVIVVTSSGREEDIRAAYELGFLLHQKTPGLERVQRDADAYQKIFV